MDKLTLLRERFAQEGYARFLGMELEELKEGYAKVRMRITKSLHNIFSSAHGGALFSLLDEAFELACNSHAEDAVAVNVTVYYLRPITEGEIIAEAREVALTTRTGIYDITAFDTSGNPIAFAKALCHRKRKD